MARARNIKHSFFSNDELGDLDPLARLLFIGMWTISDFKGDLEWRPKRIKAQILPYDECSIEDLAINLDKSGFIRFYSDGDKMFVRVVNFSIHQNPHKNERDKGSEIPEYTEEYRQLVDFKGFTINRDKSRSIRNDSHSNPADSFNLIPDSLNTDSLEKTCADKPALELAVQEQPKAPSNNRVEDKQKLEVELADSFARFWDAGLRKLNKKKSEAIFYRLLKSKSQTTWPSFTEFIVLDIQKRIHFGQLGITEMHPTTYLNGERWRDEIVNNTGAHHAKPNTAVAQDHQSTDWANGLIDSEIIVDADGY